jgi:hypothetical protein
MIIYLYIKQHSITKLKYFGKTMKRDPFKYNGSGDYWISHITKHGKKYIKTLEIWGFDDQQLCTDFALTFSAENNIVESDEWANLRPENGIDGLPAGYNGHMTPARRKAHSDRWMKNNPNDLPGAKERQRDAITGDKNPTKRPDVQEKLKGPRPGFLPHNHYTGWDQKTKNKIAKSLAGHTRSEESIKKQKQSRQNLVWMQHPTEKSLQVKNTEIAHYESLGFVMGRGVVNRREIMPIDQFVDFVKTLGIDTVAKWKTYYNSSVTPDTVFCNQKREYDVRGLHTTWKQLLGK